MYIVMKKLVEYATIQASNSAHNAEYRNALLQLISALKIVIKFH